MKKFEDAIDYPLITKEEIKKRNRELGQQITNDYKNKNENLLIIGILRGAVMFLTDLVKEIEIPVQIDFMAVSSYGNSSTSSGIVRIIKDLEEEVEDKNILIVEDIIDTGLTLKYISENLKARGAKSVRIATFLDKIERRKVDVRADYVGFNIPDEFVIGYGLDYAQDYRNLPYVAVLKHSIYE
ncbi:MAG: hypoxanthine phosphoribosyltransferase [Tissierellia bacterium]|nr:hypoxanthine phosphoribosyltransferase [Tissierellia bacterium]